MQFNLDETGRQSIYIREETFWDLNATAARGSIDFTFLNSGFGFRQIVSTTSLMATVFERPHLKSSRWGPQLPLSRNCEWITRVKHSLWPNGIYVIPKHKRMHLHILVRPPSHMCTQSDMHTLVLIHMHMYVHNWHANAQRRNLSAKKIPISIIKKKILCGKSNRFYYNQALKTNTAL